MSKVKIGRHRLTVPGGLYRAFGGLLAGAQRITLSYMKNVLTIRLEPELEKLLARLAKQTKRSRSDLVREALWRQLNLLRFEELRRRLVPFAEARGYLTDEDVYRDVS
jgi:predicted transcriptional regulator